MVQYKTFCMVSHKTLPQAKAFYRLQRDACQQSYRLQRFIFKATDQDHRVMMRELLHCRRVKIGMVNLYHSVLS